MADYIFDTETPTGSAFDGGWHTLGIEAQAQTVVTIVGGRAWFPASTPVNFRWLVYKISDMSVVAEVNLAALPSPVMNDWNLFTSAAFITPGDIPWDPGTDGEYAVVVATNGDFVFANGASYPVSHNAVIKGLNSRFFNGGAGPTFPSITNTSDYFFADILVQATPVGIDATLAVVLPALVAAMTATMDLPAVLAVTLPPITAAFTAAPALSATLAAPLPALTASFTAFAPAPPTPSGTGSLTIAVGVYAQLEAAAQHLLCWAGRPEQVQVLNRVPGGQRLYIPETAFGAGPLVMKPGGPDLLAGFVTGEQRLVTLGNAEATEVDPGTCTIGPIPAPTSLTTRVGGNPARVNLTYSNAPNGLVNIFWGDNTADYGAAQAGTIGHQYPSEGVYTITIQDATAAADIAVFAVAVP